MATVKRTAIVGDLFIEFGSKEIEIFRIAPDGSGALKRVDDTQGAIRRIAEDTVSSLFADICFAYSDIYDEYRYEGIFPCT